MLVEFYKLIPGRKFRKENHLYMKVYNPFRNLGYAGIINAVNLNTALVCHFNDNEMVELVNE